MLIKRTRFVFVSRFTTEYNFPLKNRRNRIATCVELECASRCSASSANGRKSHRPVPMRSRPVKTSSGCTVRSTNHHRIPPTRYFSDIFHCFSRDFSSFFRFTQSKSYTCKLRSVIKLNLIFLVESCRTQEIIQIASRLKATQTALISQNWSNF